MTALEQNRLRSHGSQGNRRRLHVAGVDDGPAEQHLGLRDVRRHDRSERQQAPPEHIQCLRVEQAAPPAGRQYRIDHQRAQAMGFDRRRDRFYGLRPTESSSLGRGDRHVGGDCADLAGHRGSREHEDLAHLKGVLGGHQGDRGRAPDTDRGKRLEVCLHPGSPSRI